MKKDEADFLGDGVYIKFDGFGYTLMANSHINPSDTIYLEPTVLAALKRVTESSDEIEKDW